MRRLIVTAALVALAVATAGSAQAQYYGENVRISSATALAGGAAGAAIGGPYGFAIGTVVGAAIGSGPRITQRKQECWYDRAGMRLCRFY